MKNKTYKCRFCTGTAGRNGLCSNCIAKLRIIRSRKIWKTEHQKLLEEMSGSVKGA